MSPVLHRAAFAALGLDWSYDRLECDAAALPGLVRTSGPSWGGFSVTMPGKHAALAVADEVTERARIVGAANTLVRVTDGWRADCTDVDGVTGALRAHGFPGVTRGRAVVLGAGGTAQAALVGVAELGVRAVTLVVREPRRAGTALRTAEGVGLETEVVRVDEPRLAGLVETADVVVSTLPQGVADSMVNRLRGARILLDVVYEPWPTVLAQAVLDAGGVVATGLDMLLHQAFGQCAQFTERPVPRARMRAALVEATGGRVPLPLP